ncbi:CaCA family Na+/Ca+ antiporter [Methanocaldococcus villosus KIN24-T80]|uniref:CaCA family Na+/Ca+ antiporter n=1 Tax=Methanocaldococcus villosus KIN24-T80 TaxID=1069083 RepID=N6VXY5_9EURY|nr:calcium/sodium antiporter [Methanocaldococcus villosus]ENN95997.1 CaCA family Na+/Ca+ antiporter [Methanocaldococcus villosus KIN24-T80]
MLLGIIYFFIGLVLLYYGSDWFVVGGEKTAKFFNVSNFVIGATVIAFGTSVPEIVSSVYAALTKSSGIAVGNAIGSCVCNIGLILAISSIVYPIIIKKDQIKNILFHLFFVALTFILGVDGYNCVDGAILFLTFIFYIIWVLKNDKIEKKKEEEEINIVISLIFLIIGLISVLIGAKLFIDGAKMIAFLLHIPDYIIGFSLVAFGTSVPELMVSIAAAKRRLGGMILGNIIGSNIADIGGALAISSFFSYLPTANIQMVILLIMSILLYIFAKKSKITRFDGLILLILYIFAIKFLF